MISMVAAVAVSTCWHMHSSRSHHAYHKRGKNLIAISLWDVCTVYAEHAHTHTHSSTSHHVQGKNLIAISLWDFCPVHAKHGGRSYWVRVCTSHHVYHKQGKNLIVIVLWDFCLVFDKHGGRSDCIGVSTHLSSHGRHAYHKQGNIS